MMVRSRLTIVAVPLLLLLGPGCPRQAARPAAPHPAEGPPAKRQDHGQAPLGRATAGPKDPPLAILDGDRPPPLGTRVTCPVCGDEFDVQEKHPMRHYKGKVFLFCCERCLPHFDKDPEMFLKQ